MQRSEGLSENSEDLPGDLKMASVKVYSQVMGLGKLDMDQSPFLLVYSYVNLSQMISFLHVSENSDKNS